MLTVPLDFCTMARFLRSAACALLMLASIASPLTGLAASVVKTDQARAELIAHAPEGVKPGAPLTLGLLIEHKAHWHTYWKNPGDSGLPTTLSFTLPDGFRVGDIAWPTPRPLPVGPLMNFGYEGNVLLPVEVIVPEGWQGPTLEIKLRADWLICKDVCIPEGGDFTLSLAAQSATALHAAAFAATKAATPLDLPAARATAVVGEQGLMVTAEGLPEAWRGKTLAFMPELAGVIDNAAKPKTQWDGERWSAGVPLSSQRSESPSQMHAVLVADGEPRGLRVLVAVTGTWPSPGAAPSGGHAREEASATTPAAAPIPPTTGFWGALLLAVVGGMLLNLMPCVFPVLSLKLLGFAGGGQQRQEMLAGGLAYTAGVVFSFLALAGLMMALREGGQQLGWGFQLQSPMFVSVLAALFTLIGLNLAGVFEFGSLLPSSLASARARHPVVDSLLTGVLAVAVASPCTAPFMGASLGLAATLPVGQALAIFAALGFGMAAPYLAASAWPPLARALPRPGPWMAHFKSLMAFPMFATVIWLLWVVGHQTGVDGATALLSVLLALALVAWSLGSPSLGSKARWGFATGAALCLALTLSWATPSLSSQTAVQASANANTGGGSADSTNWQPWSAERVQTALSTGQPVFVDFTAAWCVTCQFNKRTVLNQPEVLADMAAKRVLLLRADWTRQDSAITGELARMGRNGVPVYALHVPGEAQPRLLGEILSVQEVRTALKGLP